MFLHPLSVISVNPVSILNEEKILDFDPVWALEIRIPAYIMLIVHYLRQENYDGCLLQLLHTEGTEALKKAGLHLLPHHWLHSHSCYPGYVWLHTSCFVTT